MSTAAAEETGPIDPRPSEDAPPDESKPLVARASTSYRVRWGLIGLMCIAAGGWFAYDGWVTYPRENAAARAQGAEKLPHGEDLDIPIQKGLGIVLPPIGLLLIGYMLRQSRGEYRLEGNVLHVPGHPPVPLENVRQIDETKWDRKGIVFLDYENTASGQTGRLRLDDQRYAMADTDAIFDRIKAVLVPAGEGEAAGSDAGPSTAEAADDEPGPSEKAAEG